jgi:hypothetical protein
MKKIHFCGECLVKAVFSATGYYCPKCHSRITYPEWVLGHYDSWQAAYSNGHRKYAARLDNKDLLVGVVNLD